MLVIENVHKTFFPGSVNEKKALQGVNLTLRDGDFVLPGSFRSMKERSRSTVPM